MNKNVIILTYGGTGSSIFSALIGQAKYWQGENTFKKSTYDTHENIELIKLNKRLLSELEFEGKKYTHEFDHSVVEELAEAAEKIDLAPYKTFIEKCQTHHPWIWKDPRLIWTIRIWAKFLPMNDISFVISTRDDEQAWISLNLRRHIQSQAFTKKYHDGVIDSFKIFLKEYNKEYVEFEFEELILRPKWTIEKLSEFLRIKLSIDDLKAVYSKPLYKKSNGFRNKLVATAIYLKNYGQRAG